MNLPKVFVRRPVTTLMVFMGLLIVGIFALVQLPIDFFPEIEPPIVSVLTSYPGASAQDVEKNVTKILETSLGTVSELKKISSTSMDNVSVVMLEFEWGTNLNEASNNVRDALEFAKRRLPDDAETPMIFKFSTSLMPIVFLAVTAEENYPGLNKIIEQKIADPLKRIPGVGTVIMFGGPIRQIQINIDPKRLEAYNLSIQRIGQALQAENITMPAGSIKMERMEYYIRVPGEFADANQIANIVVAKSPIGGGLVYLKDVAEVKDTLKERTINVRLNGGRGLMLIIQKQSGANTVAVASAVKIKLEDLKKYLPSDVKLEQFFDPSLFILNSVRNLTEAILLGGLFVSLVVLAFLRRWKATVIIILTIPFSLIVAFIYLYFSGNTINIISLSSLSIAIGMVVDDAIVILENISRHVERGARPREASIFGSTEVGLAVTAATLTIVAVFFPLTFLTGMAGIMFKQLGYLVTVTILTSLFASLTLIPMLSSRWLKSRKEEEQKPKRFQKLFDKSEKIFTSIETFYGKALEPALDHRKFVIIAGIVIFFVVVGSFPFLGKGTEFMPKSDESQIQIYVELQTGNNLDETIKTAKQVEEIIQKEAPEISFLAVRSGINDEGFSSALFGAKEGLHMFNIQTRLSRKNERERSVFEIADLLREKLQPIAGITQLNIFTASTPIGSGKPLAIDIIGHDLDKTTKLANEMAEIAEKTEGTRDVDISRSQERPELQVMLNRDKLAMIGLNTSTVATAIRNSMYGLTPTRYREGGDEYDIFIRYNTQNRTSISDLENVPITTMTGQIVKLKDIGKVVEEFSPPDIKRKNQERVVTVAANTEGRSLGDITNDLKAAIAKIDIPTDVTIEFAGQVEQQQETFQDLLLFMILSIFLVYIVMASQFESLLDPFIIMFSVPFSFVGVFLALMLTGQTFSVISFLGAVLLIGIVVKNAIVLIDYTNITRARGIGLREAIIYSGKNRLRPVLMTTITTLLGMLPLALSTGEGSETWNQLGISVIGGLTVSTIITLVFVPVIYSLFRARQLKKEVD
ncbi:MAG: efflux RND transporter permease subunit [Bacteroidota bacterium]|nr:efflux RND transporter permease subunit [Bacteroidota bacterium]